MGRLRRKLPALLGCGIAVPVVIRTGTRGRAADGAWNMSPFSVFSSGASLAGSSLSCSAGVSPAFVPSGGEPDAGETPALQDAPFFVLSFGISLAGSLGNPGNDSRLPLGPALKGRARIAQGNALGYVSPSRYALKGQPETRTDRNPATPQLRCQIPLHIEIEIEIAIGIVIGTGNRRP